MAAITVHLGQAATSSEAASVFSPADARRLAEEITLRRTAECLGDLHLRRQSVARRLLIAAHTRNTPLHRHLNGAPVRATTHEHLVLLHRAARQSLEG
ncbi:MAG: hypothetical protein AB1832_01090 [Pseudomonadota bacterium]